MALDRQQLVMTPQLQQAIKVLQLPLSELEALVQDELDAKSEPTTTANKSKKSK